MEDEDENILDIGARNIREDMESRPSREDLCDIYNCSDEDLDRILDYNEMG